MDDDYSGADPADTATHDSQSLFLNKKAVTLDARGGARLVLDSVPDVSQPQRWLFEASYSDPNGEIQTLSQTVRVWPASVVAGIRTPRWITKGKLSDVRVVALSPAGEPQAYVPVSVTGPSKQTYSTRKRMVGGFYSYDTHVAVDALRPVCQGGTNGSGVLCCPV